MLNNIVTNNPSPSKSYYLDIIFMQFTTKRICCGIVTALWLFELINGNLSKSAKNIICVIIINEVWGIKVVYILVHQIVKLSKKIGKLRILNGGGTYRRRYMGHSHTGNHSFNGGYTYKMCKQPECSLIGSKKYHIVWHKN